MLLIFLLLILIIVFFVFFLWEISNVLWWLFFCNFKLVWKICLKICCKVEVLNGLLLFFVIKFSIFFLCIGLKCFIFCIFFKLLIFCMRWFFLFSNFNICKLSWLILECKWFNCCDVIRKLFFLNFYMLFF